MTDFLELMNPQKALGFFFDHLPVFIPPHERMATIKALGRVTSKPIISMEELPSFTRSSVDGYAVRAKDTHGAGEAMPAYLSISGEVTMGKVPDFSIQPSEAALIHTGGMLPDGADSVVMLEYSRLSRPAEVEIYRSVAEGENCIFKGEDVKQGDEVIPAGRLLRPADLGGLSALGIMEVEVNRAPRIGILSSGDEVVPPSQIPRLGQVRDINSVTLSALVSRHGGEPVLYGILPDRLEAIRATVKIAIKECQAVIVTAGSSASTRDLTSEVISEMGTPGVLVHGVNVRPGKPTILAVCDGKPVIGLPGNPVSALVIGWYFGVPVVEYLLGLNRSKWRPYLLARLGINLPSQAGREEWIPTKLGGEEESLVAEPIFFKSNLIFTLSRADGLIYIPPDSTGLSVGEVVRVYSL